MINDSNTYRWTIVHPYHEFESMLSYCIFIGNYVSNNITYKPAIHCAVQTVYTTTYTILEHLH